MIFVVGPVVALTRYTEYYHHWEDVMYGIVIGYISIVLLVYLEKKVIINGTTIVIN